MQQKDEECYGFLKTVRCFTSCMCSFYVVYITVIFRVATCTLKNNEINETLYILGHNDQTKLNDRRPGPIKYIVSYTS